MTRFCYSIFVTCFDDSNNGDDNTAKLRVLIESNKNISMYSIKIVLSTERINSKNNYYILHNTFDDILYNTVKATQHFLPQYIT